MFFGFPEKAQTVGGGGPKPFSPRLCASFIWTRRLELPFNFTKRVEGGQKGLERGMIGAMTDALQKLMKH